MAHDERAGEPTPPDTAGPDGRLCPGRWLIEDVGRFLAGDGAGGAEVEQRGGEAVGRAAHEVEQLLRSAFAAHEVVATELRLAGPARGYRRTVLASAPSPAALMLLCLRLCDRGDDVSVLQHTAAHGTVTRTATWPFGMAEAEHMTRPPERDTGPLPGDLATGDGRRPGPDAGPGR